LPSLCIVSISCIRCAIREAWHGELQREVPFLSNDLLGVRERDEAARDLSLLPLSIQNDKGYVCLTSGPEIIFNQRQRSEIPSKKVEELGPL